MTKYFLFLFLISCSFKNDQEKTNVINLTKVFGSYRLKYYPKLSDWDYNNIEREELLIIRKDSTYTLERIHPQGTFAILPVNGKWRIIDSKLELDSKRIFEIGNEYLTEPICEERDDLSNIHWYKE